MYNTGVLYSSLNLTVSLLLKYFFLLVFSFFILNYHNLFRNFFNIFKGFCGSKNRKKISQSYNNLLNISVFFCIIKLLIKAFFFLNCHSPISVSALGIPPHGHRPEVLSVWFITKVRCPKVDVCVSFVAQSRGAHLPQLLQLPVLLLLRGLSRVVSQEEIADEGPGEVRQPPTATLVGFLKGRTEGKGKSAWGAVSLGARYGEVW